MRNRRLMYALVFFVLGFLITISFEHARTESDIVQLGGEEWEEEFFYRNQLIELEEKNKQLRSELNQMKQEINKVEASLSDEKDSIHHLVDMKNKLQKLTGALPIKGEGIQITLEDATYVPNEEHANNYIVHDRHIHTVINELYSAGAKAISINGQRIFRSSHITCVGPVILIDGQTYPAPFVISAIGDSEILNVSLQLKNGVMDYLVQDHVQVTIEKKGTIEMQAKEM